MIREPSESAIDQAAKRLERAVARLEQKLTTGEGFTAAAPLDADTAKLAAELDKVRSRERQLEEAGAAASEALGRAIAEIRSVLSAPAAAPAGE
ncbi:DUF4164 family protein [Phenylobacterium sp.]|uniref:DUF4164 family protein n=1 Tax=Phenylobacterium sp. TaxID=1871053 RepID=UPI0035B4967A